MKTSWNPQPPGMDERFVSKKLAHAACAFLALLFTAPFLKASELQRFDECRLVDVVWSDGDSFPVRLPDGSELSVRLYGADTLETRISDSTLARRLRAQRRYFGISDYGGSPQSSIQLAKELGMEATKIVQQLLEKPFTVHTSFADGRGSESHKRVYAFVTTHDGQDLATALVRRGLARAFGVYRSTPSGLHQDEYRATLQDAEFVAARRGAGIWNYTDWDALPEERQAQRLEETEDAIAMGRPPLDGPVSINRATSQELAALPGIGPALAERIIAARPFTTTDELLKVSGIGRKTYAAIEALIEL